MRLLLVDDHKLVLEGLRGMLARLFPHAEIEVETDALRALERLRANQAYDLLLIDLSMPGFDGFEFIARLEDLHVLVPVVVVSALDDPVTIARAESAGALGFISKGASASVMRDTLRAVLSGTPDFPVERPESNDAPEADPHGLRPRQVEVLRFAEQGHSNREIADLLGLTEHTVKSHLAAAYRHFGVGNRSACIFKARQAGVLDA